MHHKCDSGVNWILDHVMFFACLPQLLSRYFLFLKPAASNVLKAFHKMRLTSIRMRVLPPHFSHYSLHVPVVRKNCFPFRALLLFKLFRSLKASMLPYAFVLTKVRSFWPFLSYMKIFIRKNYSGVCVKITALRRLFLWGQNLPWEIHWLSQNPGPPWMYFPP